MAAQYRPSIRCSFESMLCSGLDRRTMVIEVVLKHKRTIFLRNRRGQVVDFYETDADSNVSFLFRFDSLGLSYFNFRAQICLRMPGLAPSLCAQLSQQIFLYAQRLALTRQDHNGVKAFVEIEEPEVQPTETDDDDNEETGLQAGAGAGAEAGIDDNGDAPAPRGLSWGEINRLKQERFNSNGADQSICSICLEEFSPGVNITPLPCSHTFHHTCIATWLHEQASCPLCRFHITQP